MQINIHENDLRISQLLNRVMAGEEVIIDIEKGKPVAKIIPYSEPPTKKARIVFGVWEGKVKIADDFDELPQDIAEALGMEG